LIEKEIHAPKLASAIDVLQQLPGRRLFQYSELDDAVHAANAREVNEFLRELAGVEISLKDFRTLLASVQCSMRWREPSPHPANGRGAGRSSMRFARPPPSFAIRPRFAARAMCMKPS
jgi:hypothetical protein